MKLLPLNTFPFIRNTNPMPLSLSVIIPTHRRADILRQCLEHLEKQSIKASLEVIVIHDGHDDKTDALMAKSTWQIPVYYESIPKSQQGVARNVGVQKARASTCLFIGDDTFLAPDACEHHLRVHGNNDSLAVLGKTVWDPTIDITPVMQWLDTSGWQFGYEHIAQYASREIPEAIQHRYTYTIHISIPTAVAKRTPFRENVSLYGWEDVEWGMQLRDGGVRLYYEPRALAYHHHHMALSDSLKRMEVIGQSAVFFEKHVPTFDRVPKGFKYILYKISALLPTMAGKHRAAFLRGMRKV